MTEQIYTKYEELLKLPHLLVAGATGCGKSTVIDSLLYTAMYQTPAPIFLLIDPKKIDLLKYQNIRLTARRAEELPEAVEILKIANKIIDYRFTELKSAGGFQTVTTRPPVYVVIDELASLTSKLNGKQSTEAINLIIRIVNLGRACRVHLIGATQTVKANILPSELTNNTTVIGLHCRNSVQSRVLIGESGCEHLPAHGVALINYGDRIERTTVPMTPPEKLRAIIDYWR